MRPAQLAGRRILLVEDDYYQAKELQHLLRAAGATILGPTDEIAEVVTLLERETVDVALLDINLGQEASYEIPALLRDRGVPFLFLTGYDQEHVPAAFAAIPVLQKPADEQEILASLIAHERSH